MNVIAQMACELLERGETFILATIISHTGSTPRTSGSKMIVTGDGRGVGTIGGGMLEAGAMARSIELIRKRRSALMPVDMRHDSVDGMDMICGGQADVLLDCLSPTADNLAIFSRWRRMLDEREKGCLVTIVMGSEGTLDRFSHCLATASGEMIGAFPLSSIEKDKVLSAAVGSTSVQTLAVDGAFVVLEPAVRVSAVYLFGAGHVSRSTAAMAVMVGFRVLVSDDREEFANRRRFPDTHEIRVLESFDRSFSELSIGRADFIVILTRGHLHDKTVLAQALKTKAGYIGMIGSRKKRNAIYGALLKEGFSQADIDRVHSPIGLSIGAETPEEIAVSITAEMIQCRYKIVFNE
jgi:xanthine dehydrogenase accessory factor